jgi:hypothetical protein
MPSIIYTALFGNYDTLNQRVAQDTDCDFVCFTDQRLPARIGAWHVVHIKASAGLHPRVQAKRFKLLSHKVFRNRRLAFRYRLRRGGWSVSKRYTCSIWIDGSVAIKSKSFARDITTVATGAPGWAMFRHPDRDCVFEEVAVSSAMEKYRGLPIFEQVDAYRQEGVSTRRAVCLRNNCATRAVE